MKLLDRLRRERCVLIWQYKAESLIWRLLSTGTHKIIGESRDLEKKSTGYFCIDDSSGKVVWENVRFEEAWWIGIEGVTEDVLILHLFASPDLPVHRGIIAVDLHTGKNLWTHRDLTVVRIGRDSLVASRSLMGGEELIAVDPATGGILGGVNEGSGERQGSSDADDGLRMPEPLADASALPRGVKLVVEKHARKENGHAPAELLEFGDLMVLHYCEGVTGGTAVRNVVKVLQKESGVELYRDTMDSGASGFVPDAFLVRDGMLYYVRERTELLAVSLGESPASMNQRKGTM